MNSIHTVIHLGISAPDCETMPTLILYPDSEEPHASFTVARYARYIQKEGHASYATIVKDLKYIGLLFDYFYLIAKPNFEEFNDWELFIESFLNDFDKGAVLNWKAASNKEYSYCKNTIREFCKFVFGKETKRKLLPNEELDIEASISRSYEYSAHLKSSLLFHVKRHSSNIQSSHANKKRGRKRSSGGSKLVKFFPPEYLTSLIDETPNVRDKIILLMAGYGGRRQCEIVQILVNDVEPTNGRLEVMLAHPEDSSMTWINRIGRRCSGTREEYLKSMYGLKSRLSMGGLPSKAGWKGIKYDDAENQKSYMWFIEEKVERYLLYLHMRYMKEVRNNYTHHPYYFVDQSGEPLKMKGMYDLIDRACKRLEKKYGVNLKGKRGHSLRHHYGFYCADILEMDLLMIRKYMGHKKISSTAIYTHISPEKARLALQNAQDEAKLKNKIDISEEERLEIQQRLEIQRSFEENRKAATKIPDSWMTSWLTGDELDTMLITR